MGIRGRLRRGCLVRSVLLAWLSNRPNGHGSIRPVSGGGPDHRHWPYCVHAHGRVARPDPDHRTHAAVHVIWTIQPGDLPARHGDTHQFRTVARERSRDWWTRARVGTD